MVIRTNGVDSFNPALAALRVGLVAYVVASISNGIFFPSIPALGRPEAAVTGLLVLAGFLLAMREPHGSGQEVWAFLARRLAAIWPLHIAVLGIALLLSAGPRENALLAESLLANGWIPLERVYSGLSPLSWLLSAHLVLIVFYLLLAPGFDRHWRMTLASSLAGALVMVAGAAALGAPERSSERADATGLVVIHPFVRLFEFVLGMAAALAARTLRDRMTPGFVLRWTGLEGAALAVLVGALTIHGHLASGLRAWFGTSLGLFLEHALIAPAFAGVIIVAALGRGAISRAVPKRPAAALDEIAFSVLLLHAVLTAVYVRHRLFFDAPGLHALGIVLILDLVVALALVRIVTRPAKTLALRTSGGPLLPVSATRLAFRGIRSPFTFAALAGLGALAFAVHVLWRPNDLTETRGPPPDIEKAGNCVLDSVTSKPGYVLFNGWQADIAEGATPEPVIIRLIGDGGTFTTPARRGRRPDVAAHFKQPALIDAGYRGMVTQASIPIGSFAVQIETGTGRARRACVTKRRFISDGRGLRTDP